MKTKQEVIKLLSNRPHGKRGSSITFKQSGDLQCSVGFLSSFDYCYKAVDAFYKGFTTNNYNEPLLIKDKWPAIWLFTLTEHQQTREVVQDIIVGLNAVELYNYMHHGHGNRMSLYMADPDYFNYDFIYDISEQQMKEEGSLK